MQQHPWVTSTMVADGTGREHMLLRTDEQWRNRQSLGSKGSGRAVVWEWAESPERRAESEETLDYDPRGRPWYRGAVENMEAAGGTPWIYWTEPYTFFTTRDPGITASTAFRAPDGGLRVLGFDVLLLDISRFTTQIEVHGRGFAFVLSDDGRLVGTPAGAAPLERRQSQVPASQATRGAGHSGGARCRGGPPGAGRRRHPGSSFHQRGERMVGRGPTVRAWAEQELADRSGRSGGGPAGQRPPAAGLDRAADRRRAGPRHRAGGDARRALQPSAGAACRRERADEHGRPRGRGAHRHQCRRGAESRTSSRQDASGAQDPSQDRARPQDRPEHPGQHVSGAPARRRGL